MKMCLRCGRRIAPSIFDIAEIQNTTVCWVNQQPVVKPNATFIRYTLKNVDQLCIECFKEEWKRMSKSLDELKTIVPTKS